MPVSGNQARKAIVSELSGGIPLERSEWRKGEDNPPISEREIAARLSSSQSLWYFLKKVQN
jgi:hypothetical protein